MKKQDILEAIREKRKDLKISQGEMSVLLGVSQSQYSSLESGNSEITLDKLVKICEILNIELIGFKEIEKKNDDKIDMIYQELLKVAKKLKDL
jgi:transcriptional regulator with XRE-family HTH domain